MNLITGLMENAGYNPLTHCEKHVFQTREEEKVASKTAASGNSVESVKTGTKEKRVSTHKVPSKNKVATDEEVTASQEGASSQIAQSGAPATHEVRALQG